MEKVKMFERIRKEIEGDSYILGDLKTIDYGVQFYVYGRNSKDTVRIFESKKKGTRVDLSQVKDYNLKSMIENIDFDGVSVPCAVKYRVSELGIEDKLVKLYEKIELRAPEFSIKVLDLKRIDYGMQIKLLLPSGWVELIRVYNSSKRGIFLDLSLIQSSKNLNILDDLYELSYSDYLKATLLTIPSRKQLLKKSSPKRRSKEKKKNEKQKKVKLRNEIEESKAQKPFLEKVALNIIEYTKKNGISVMRYDSKISESIYLKFDYGMAGSLRISAHNSKKTELQYTFNIIKGLDKPCVKTGKTSSGKECQMYFYPFELAKNVAYDIVRYKNYRVCKYGDLSYENCMYKHKSLVGVRSGFWSKAIEV